jgi:hypothetical protein
MPGKNIGQHHWTISLTVPETVFKGLIKNGEYKDDLKQFGGFEP